MPDEEKYRRSIYPPSINAGHNYGASRIGWRRIANVNETIKIKSLVFRGPKNFQFAAASRRAALSGNRSLMTISGPCSGVYHLGHYKHY